MNSTKYSEWASHYDPKNLEMQLLRNHGLRFEGSKVLEIGCGTGRFTKRIIDYCSSITCIDPDEGAISFLKASISSPKLRVVCGTLESIVLENDYYDFVIFPWSLYLIPNQSEVLSLSNQYLKPGGRVIILQAKSGEYEEEISILYKSYDSMMAYSKACASLPTLVSRVFGSISTDTLSTYFEFDSIEQVVNCSLFFVEDEEGRAPCESKVSQLRERLLSYLTPNGKVVMSDIVSLIIAEKKLIEEAKTLGTLRVLLDVKHSQNNTIFSCCIQNIGNTTIGLHNTFLFLDEGVFNPQNNLYEFPFLQKKYLGIDGISDNDCIGCAHCRKGDSSYPMQYPHIRQFYDEFRFEPFCQCYPLHHLSSDSILYMAPNESFTEELVVKLKKGVYRAILMCVPNSDSCDCMCCNKCFVIE